MPLMDSTHESRNEMKEFCPTSASCVIERWGRRDDLDAGRRRIGWHLLLGVVMWIGGCEPGPEKVGQTSVTTGPSRPTAASVGATGQPLTETAVLFNNHCGTCHGASGAGDGPAAYLVYPKPRNFTTGVFRFKSTPGAQLPTTDDLRRVIKEGVPQTAMPGFADVLAAQQIDALIPHILAFSTDKQSGEALTPIQISDKPVFTAALAQQGKLVYQASGCALCHGDTGKGDGPSSMTMADSTGMPLPPADFTTGVFKSGRTSQDLYRTITVGVIGTPMPGFATAFDKSPPIPGVEQTVDKRWALVAYIESLAVPRERPGIASGAKITVAQAAHAGMLTDATHPAWSQIPSVPVALQPLWQRRRSPRAVEVRVAANKDRIAFCFEWPDETADTIDGDVRGFSDAVGIMLGLKDQVPTLTMGLRGATTGASQPQVYLCQWKASWQLHSESGEPADAVAKGGALPADMYAFKQGDLAKGPITEHDPTYITALGAGNAVASPATFRRSALESNAAGFGTLTPFSETKQKAQGKGVWVNGQWRVVIVRALAGDGEGDIDFKGRRKIPVSFAVWDGHAQDRNGTKEVSGWHWLDLERR